MIPKRTHQARNTASEKKSAENATSEHASDRKAVLRLAVLCRFDEAHARQVDRLAVMLFDAFRDLHLLLPQDRLQLEDAALLHDIGWIQGQRRHHKTALRLILKSPVLPWSPKQRLEIGSIVRYHRRALPSLSHDHFQALPVVDRHRVKWMAGLLRLADGLDFAHDQNVQTLAGRLTPARLTICCQCRQPTALDTDTARAKASLLALMIRRPIRILATPDCTYRPAAGQTA